jgi:F-type H+-transporting ATPase subunit gamma
VPSLKAFKNRIASVKSTQKITKAKQMVAAAKLRRAEERAKEARPYTERIETVLANLTAKVLDMAHAPKLLRGTGVDKTHLLIVATADKGLCGAFNSNIARLARERIVALQGEGKTVKIICVGRKGYDQLKRLYGDLVVHRCDFLQHRQIGFKQAGEIAERALKMFDAGEFDVATLFFGKFKSVVAQVPTAVQIVPALAPRPDAPERDPSRVAESAPQPRGSGAEARASNADDLKGAVYEYEPDETAILNALLPRYVAAQVYRALLENVASEQAASMTAMDNATRNAGDMIETLTLKYNRARQAQITKELIEIISALRIRAARHGRSMEEEVRRILDVELRLETPNLEGLRALRERIRARHGGQLPKGEVDGLIRERRADAARERAKDAGS